MTNRRPTPDSSGQRSALDWAEQAGLGDALVAELAARAVRRRRRRVPTHGVGGRRQRASAASPHHVHTLSVPRARRALGRGLRVLEPHESQRSRRTPARKDCHEGGDRRD